MSISEPSVTPEDVREQTEIARTQNSQNSLKLSKMLHSSFVELNDARRLLKALVDQKTSKDLRPGLSHPPSRICGGGCLNSSEARFALRFLRVPAI